MMSTNFLFKKANFIQLVNECSISQANYIKFTLNFQSDHGVIYLFE